MSRIKNVYLFFIDKSLNFIILPILLLNFPLFSFAMEALSSEIQNASAEDLFNAGLYEKAEAAYLGIVTSKEKTDPELSIALLRLSQLYTSTHQYQKIIDLLKQFNDPQNNQTLTYFAGLAYSRLHNHMQALNAFQNYLSSNDPSYSDEAHFEIAFIYFSEKKYTQSLDELKQIKHPKTNLKVLVAIYSSRIYLQTDRAVEAIQLLGSQDLQISNDDSLRFEMTFLIGNAHFLLREYEKAIPFLLQATYQSQDTAPWYSECLYDLGMAYLYSGNYDKAIFSFHEFLKKYPEERGYLGLGEAYYASGDFSSAEKLLSSPHLFTTTQGQKAALLLQIKTASTYSARNCLYCKLIEMDTNNGFTWYYHALNDMEEGISLKSNNNGEMGEKLLLKAMTSFEKAIALSDFSDKSLAAQAIKYQAIAAHQINQNLKAIHILEKLMESNLW